MELRKIRKMKSLNDRVILTLTNWSWIWIVPSAIGLAANNPLPPVVISWVTYEHHYGIKLVLSSIYQPPSPMFYSRVANVGTGHSWKVRGYKKLNNLPEFHFIRQTCRTFGTLKSQNLFVLTDTSGQGLSGTPPPRVLTYHWDGNRSSKPKSRITLVHCPCS